jgi:hypothetical protein
MHQFQLHIDLWDQTDSYTFRYYHHHKGPKITSNVKFASHVREEIRLRMNEEFEVKWNLVMQEKFKQHNWGQWNPTSQFSPFESIHLANFGTPLHTFRTLSYGEVSWETKNPMKKSVLSTRHPSMVVHSCVLLHSSLNLSLIMNCLVQGGHNAQTSNTPKNLSYYQIFGQQNLESTLAFHNKKLPQLSIINWKKCA